MVWVWESFLSSELMPSSSELFSSTISFFASCFFHKKNKISFYELARFRSYRNFLKRTPERFIKIACAWLPSSVLSINLIPWSIPRTKHPYCTADHAHSSWMRSFKRPQGLKIRSLRHKWQGRHGIREGIRLTWYQTVMMKKRKVSITSNIPNHEDFMKIRESIYWRLHAKQDAKIQEA